MGCCCCGCFWFCLPAWDYQERSCWLSEKEGRRMENCNGSHPQSSSSSSSPFSCFTKQCLLFLYDVFLRQTQKQASRHFYFLYNFIVNNLLAVKENKQSIWHGKGWGGRVTITTRHKWFSSSSCTWVKTSEKVQGEICNRNGSAHSSPQPITHRNVSS